MKDSSNVETLEQCILEIIKPLLSRVIRQVSWFCPKHILVLVNFDECHKKISVVFEHYRDLKYIKQIKSIVTLQLLAKHFSF